MARIVEDSYLKALCDWIIGCDEHYEMDKSRVLAEIKEDLENMQEVIRCKNCKYINREIHAKGYGCLCDAHSCDRKGHKRYVYVEDDDFCSYGERREGE